MATSSSPAGCCSPAPKALAEKPRESQLLQASRCKQESLAPPTGWREHAGPQSAPCAPSSSLWPQLHLLRLEDCGRRNSWDPHPPGSLYSVPGVLRRGCLFQFLLSVMRRSDRRNNLSPGRAVLWGGAGSERLPSRGVGGEGVAGWLTLSPGLLSHSPLQDPGLP